MFVVDSHHWSSSRYSVFIITRLFMISKIIYTEYVVKCEWNTLICTEFVIKLKFNASDTFVTFCFLHFTQFIVHFIHWKSIQRVHDDIKIVCNQKSLHFTRTMHVYISLNWIMNKYIPLKPLFSRWSKGRYAFEISVHKFAATNHCLRQHEIIAIIHRFGILDSDELAFRETKFKTIIVHSTIRT